MAMRYFYVSLLSVVCVLAPVCSAGANTDSVFEEVISHYIDVGDEQKLAAARFLSENSSYRKFHGSELMERYYGAIDSINRKLTYPDCMAAYEDLRSMLGDPEIGLRELHDTDILCASDIISNIDEAFEDWREGYWAHHLSFDQFCEHLLPYVVTDEQPAPFRDELRSMYYQYTNGVRMTDDQKYSAYFAARSVNGWIKRRKFHNQWIWLEDYAPLPISALMHIRMGDCFDYARYTVYAMRACGIPVSLDFTPQWPNRANGHYWNGLLDNTGKTIPFMGGESNPGEPCKHGNYMAKVYRYTFAYQEQSLFARNKEYNEEIPPILDTPFIKDVSEEYFNGTKLTLQIKEPERKLVFLAVFDNQQWVPVDGEILDENQHVIFHNIGRNIVYMPVYWINGNSVQAHAPVYVDWEGESHILIPDTSARQSAVLYRKFPLFRRVYDYRNLMYKGRLEGANDSLFSDSKVVATIMKVPLFGYDTLRLEQPCSYRFWRYVAPRGSKCNVAEIGFLCDSTRLDDFTVFCDGTEANGFRPELAFDKNELSYYESKQLDLAWIGVDFGKPVSISSFFYVPRNDDNNIKPGHTYELRCYTGDKCKILWKKKAESNYLQVEGLPCNGLYLLHDCNEGTEERIFIVENEKIKWF